MITCLNKVLKACAEQARKGESNINVFELMYETSLPYIELKEVLDKLIEDKELEAVDIKTYKFIGDINRKFEAAPKQDKLADKRAELERKRQEIIARMRRDMEEESVDINSIFVEPSYEDETDEEKSSVIAERFEKIVDFITIVFIDGHKNDVAIETPVHTLWGNEEELLRHCAEQIIELFLKNENSSRNMIINKAQLRLNRYRKTNNTKSAEAYERVVYELQNISNYYFNKIKKLCSQGLI